MYRSHFLALLLVSSLLFFSFSNGFGRGLTETVEHEHSTARAEEISGKWRIMMEVMDYGDPEANTNPKYGDLFSPPSPAVNAPSP